MRNSIYLTLALAVSYVQAENLLDIAEEEELQRLLQAEDEEERRILQVQGRCIDGIDNVDQIDSHCYFKSPFYQAQTAEEKMEQAWSKLAPEEDGDDEPIGIWFDKFPQFFEQKSNGSFCQRSDSIQRNRDKIIHNQGLIAQVEWEPVNNANGYTGIYSTGSNKVIMRVSEAQVVTEASSGLTPAAAFKFMIDGQESQNLLVQNSFMASDSWNFFKEPLANRVAAFDPVEHEVQFNTVHRKLLEANAMPYGTAISHIANKYVNGDSIERADVSIPYELRFRLPASEMDMFDFQDNDVAWYDRLRAGLGEGDVIYEVYGLTAPEDLGGTEVHIANVRMLTDLLASEAGDEFLYFRHRPQHIDRRFFKDRKWKGHMWRTERFERNEDTIWNQDVPEGVWPEDNEEAEAFYIAQQEEFGCPFAWLLQ